MKRMTRLLSLLLCLSILLCFTVSCEIIPRETPVSSVSVTVESGPVTTVSTLAMEPDREPLDYDALQRQIDEIIAGQQEAGFIVEEITILYIDEEQIQNSPEVAESFVRLTIGELEAFHGSPLRLTCDGVIEGEVIAPDDFITVECDGEGWTDYLNRMVLGSGILVIGVCLSMATGGTFMCAVTTLVGASAAEAGISAASTFLFSYAARVGNGMSSEQAARSALRDAANVGSADFLRNAIVGTLMAPLVKSCFPAGTLVATVDRAVPIEAISVGDMVYTRAENGRVELRPVVDVTVGYSRELVNIHLKNGQIMTATPSHPLYVPSEDAYLPGEELMEGDTVLTLEGDIVPVGRVERWESEEPIAVYNLSTAQNHNYYIHAEGDDEAPFLVHNSCLHRSWKWIKERKNHWRQQADFYTMHPEYLNRMSLTNTYEVTETNLNLMRRGTAPIGTDGRCVELHHYLEGGIGKALYTYREITSTDHHSHYAELHWWQFKKSG